MFHISLNKSGGDLELIKRNQYQESVRKYYYKTYIRVSE